MSSYNTLLRQANASTRWRDCHARLRNMAMGLPGYDKDEPNKYEKQLTIQTGRQHENVAGFFEYYGDTLSSVETNEAACYTLIRHPILLPVLKEYEDFQVSLQPEVEYNNLRHPHSNGTTTSSSEDQSEEEQYHSEEEQYYDADCVKCKYTFTCPMTYQGNQPICTTCSAEMQQ